MKKKKSKYRKKNYIYAYIFLQLAINCVFEFFENCCVCTITLSGLAPPKKIKKSREREITNGFKTKRSSKKGSIFLFFSLSFSLSLSLSLSLMFSSLKLNSWTQTQSHIVLLKTKNCLFPMLFSVIFSHTWFCRKIHVWLQLLTPCAPMDFLRIWSNSP